MNKFNGIGFALIKEAMMQSIVKTSAKAIKLGFQAANKCIKRAFIYFFEMNVMEMIHQETL